MYNLTGQRFGKLFVKSRSQDKLQKSKEICWTCICDCGVTLSVRSYCLRKGNQKSCGCTQKRPGDFKHGLHNTNTYHSWEKMKSRCNNPKNPSYSRYGLLGVTYDPSWEDFSVFLKDMGERPEGRSLDRIDPFGNYEPKNCRWATWKEQANNQRRNTKFRGGDANVVSG
jgi:hypothetical protein